MTQQLPPQAGPSAPAPTDPPERFGILDWIEWAGNQLPEPVILFAILAGIVAVLSAIGSAAGWRAQPVKPQVVMVEQVDSAGQPVLAPDGSPVRTPALGADGRPKIELVESGPPLSPRSLLSTDGVYWMLSSMIRNFTSLPALGLIFVAILGIGLAEKFGFFSALMRALALVTPPALLSPVIIFIGANASVASDAGYIILPPLAAALYHAVGRHPIAGLAAAFAGVSGGFGAGFFPTGGDGVLAGFAQDAARVIAPLYDVTILHNFYFKAGSALVITLAGWYVTDRLIEPRLLRQRSAAREPDDSGVLTQMSLRPEEWRALWSALAAQVLVLAGFATLILIPGAPLYGSGQPTLATGQPAPGEGVTHRWSQAIVPIIFFAFLIPGMVYGWMAGVLRTQRDFVGGLQHAIQSIVPVLAIAFFLAQFVNYFRYTGLDRMLAYAGGSLLVQAELPAPVLLVLFVLLVIFGDFALSGMIAKFGVLAPIFIPMFMMVGLSPELTTAAYRIGDSVVNIITPMNSYVLIILSVLRRYKEHAGLGSLMSLMVPYSVVFAIVWTGTLLAWYAVGAPLGPDAPLHYVPVSAEPR